MDVDQFIPTFTLPFDATVNLSFVGWHVVRWRHALAKQHATSLMFRVLCTERILESCDSQPLFYSARYFGQHMQELWRYKETVSREEEGEEN